MNGVRQIALIMIGKCTLRLELACACSLWRHIVTFALEDGGCALIGLPSQIPQSTVQLALVDHSVGGRARRSCVFALSAYQRNDAQKERRSLVAIPLAQDMT